jgi:tetratricopeptide (TPR) repeat protein
MKTHTMRRCVLRNSWCVSTALLVVAVFSLPSIVFAQSPTMQEAEALFQNQKWPEAVKAFEAITKAAPTRPRPWFRLGSSLYALGKYQEAIPAFQKAVEIGKNPLAMYDLARAYAKVNEKDKAFELLSQALNAGFYRVSQLNDDADLAALRDDARFKEVVALGERLTKPCLAQPEYKRFDFWAGEWEVFQGGQHAGANSVQRILDSCVLFENWTSDQGPPGKSFNFYDSTTHKWQQTWVDSTGSVLNLFGEFSDKALRYTGQTLDAKGNKTLHKLTFFNLGPDRVRQLWEQSNDDGKTWTTVWDGLYVRKKSPSGDMNSLPRSQLEIRR